MDKMSLEDSAKQVASTIKDVVGSTRDSADRATRRTGERLESAADQMRDRLPDGGKAGEIADVVSSSVKQASNYLQDQGFSGIVEDLEALVRRYPLQTLLLGLGCGYLLSRLRTD